MQLQRLNCQFNADDIFLKIIESRMWIKSSDDILIRTFIGISRVGLGRVANSRVGKFWLYFGTFLLKTRLRISSPDTYTKYS